MTAPPTARSARELLVEAAATAALTTRRCGVAVRPLESLEQMVAACAVLERVWGIGPGQVFDVQPHLLRALGHGGNYLVGAYAAADDRLIGASAAFFTEPLGAAMHSHITGVLPGTAGRGVGGALKWHQRQWALERGLSRITWTFDPLIARNAFFNLTRLGARPETYFVDFYGDMDDGPNRGQPSDRVELVWDLASAPTIEAQSAARADSRDFYGPDFAGRDSAGRDGTGRDPAGPDVAALVAAGAAVLLSVGAAGEPVPGRPPPSGETTILLGIPPDIEAMRRTDPERALAWRYELRAALAFLMADTSWQVTGFARSGWYLLERRAPADSLRGRSAR